MFSPESGRRARFRCPICQRNFPSKQGTLTQEDVVLRHVLQCSVEKKESVGNTAPHSSFSDQGEIMLEVSAVTNIFENESSNQIITPPAFNCNDNKNEIKEPPRILDVNGKEVNYRKLPKRTLTNIKKKDDLCSTKSSLSRLKQSPQKKPKSGDRIPLLRSSSFIASTSNKYKTIMTRDNEIEQRENLEDLLDDQNDHNTDKKTSHNQVLLSKNGETRKHHCPNLKCSSGMSTPSSSKQKLKMRAQKKVRFIKSLENIETNPQSEERLKPKMSQSFGKNRTNMPEQKVECSVCKKPLSQATVSIDEFENQIHECVKSYPAPNASKVKRNEIDGLERPSKPTKYEHTKETIMNDDKHLQSRSQSLQCIIKKGATKMAFEEMCLRYLDPHYYNNHFGS